MSVIYTVGHSTRSMDEFAALLRESNVNLLVDVRTYPGSRHCPQFNKETMPEALRAYSIDYGHMPDLGGRRHNVLKNSTVNAWWTHPSFRSYADYAGTDPRFRYALAELVKLAKWNTCAIMCSEVVWWKCHRRIITDYLLVGGADVRHILAHGKVEPAKLTESATPALGALVYPGTQN